MLDDSASTYNTFFLSTYDYRMQTRSKTTTNILDTPVRNDQALGVEEVLGAGAEGKEAADFQRNAAEKKGPDDSPFGLLGRFFSGPPSSASAGEQK